MKAMILAAGRGERMRPLTDTCPKPLLKVLGIPLIEHHIKNLARANITDIVINHAWLGDKIESYLGDGSQFGVSIKYSREGDGALETAGGIINALPLLLDEHAQNSPFLVINGDVFTNFDFSTVSNLQDRSLTNNHLADKILPKESLAKVWLVKNPEHNLKGDFSLIDGKLVNVMREKISNTYTFTGIGLYRPAFFYNVSHEKVLALGPILRKYADNSLISGDIIYGEWTDVGTPERLNELNK